MQQQHAELWAEIQALRGEVEALRRQTPSGSRRGRWALLVGGLVAGVIFGQTFLESASAVPQGGPQDLVCKSLKVVGGGKELVVIGGDEDGGGVLIHGVDGVPRVFLGVAAKKGAGIVHLMSADKKPQLALESDADGGGVKVYGAEGNLRAYLGVADKAGGGLLNLLDSGKKVRVFLEGAADGGKILKQ
jgi:hypothetical protein